MKYVLLLLILLALSGNILLLQRLQKLERAVPAVSAADFPLGESMGYLQRYADKLWRASQAGNWGLAKYYRDEMDETAGDIIDAHLVKKAFPVSDTMKALLRPALADLGKAVEKRDAASFDKSYTALLSACNECHRASGHPFIRIVTPSASPTRWNQDFAAR